MSASPSIRELALRAVAAALASAGTPAQGVSRSRLDTIKQSELPCFDITPGEEQINDPGEFGDRTAVTRTVPVAVRAVVDAGDLLDQQPDDSALDPFYVFAVQKLTAGKATLGGLVLKVEEVSGAVVFRPAGRDLLGLEMHFHLTFATKRGDPTQKG